MSITSQIPLNEHKSVSAVMAFIDKYVVFVNLFWIEEHHWVDERDVSFYRMKSGCAWTRSASLHVWKATKKESYKPTRSGRMHLQGFNDDAVHQFAKCIICNFATRGSLNQNTNKTSSFIWLWSSVGTSEFLPSPPLQVKIGHEILFTEDLMY